MYNPKILSLSLANNADFVVALNVILIPIILLLIKQPGSL